MEAPARRSDKRKSEDEKFASTEGEKEVTNTKPRKNKPNGSPSKKMDKKRKKKIKTPKIAVNRPPVRNEDKASIDDVEKIAQNISQGKDEELDAFILDG